MAKVTLPLGGFSASGQIGKAFVYFSWKGIRVVRSYVIPANPNTPLQQTARAEFTDAVDAWHDALYNALDLASWRRRATHLTRVMSGFNIMVSRYIDLVTPADVWEELTDMIVILGPPATIPVDIQGSIGTSAVARWGTSPTYMPNVLPLIYAAGRYTGSIVGLTTGVRYYFFIETIAANEVGETGTYTEIAP